MSQQQIAIDNKAILKDAQKYRKRMRDLVGELLVKLSDKYSDDRELLLMSKLIDVADAGLIMDNVITNVLCYSERIRKNDDNLLSREDFTQKVSSIPKDEQGNVIIEIKRFRSLWLRRDTTEEDKRAIWLYLERIVDLGEKYQTIISKLSN